MKKQSVVTSIIIVLVLFTGIIFFRGCEIGPPKDPTIFDKPGTYKDNPFYKNGEILSPDITLEDAEFSESLIISDLVTEGDIYLNRLQVPGELIINGGSTIYINGGSYQTITTNAENVKVIFLGDSQIETLKAKAATTIVANEDSHVKNLIIEKGAKKSSITTQSTASIANLQIKSPADVILNSPSDSIIFGPEATGSTFVNNARVKKIQIEAKMKLTIGADVESLIITASGEGSVIELKNNAVITNLGLEKPVTVNGQGSITNATLPDISYLKGSIIPKNLSISAKPLVTDPKGGLMVTTIIARPVDSKSIASLVSQSRGYGSVINTRYQIDDQAHRVPDPPVPPPVPVPTPVPPPVPSPLPKPVAVKSIHLSDTSLNLIRGESKVVTATVLPVDAANKTVVWKSSDPTVAIVSKGIITPKGNGLATITATTVDGNFSATCQVSVKTNILAITTINDQATENNTITKTLDYGSDYALPGEVVVEGYSGERLDSPIKWNPATIDSKKPGQTIVTGSLALPDGYLNPKNIQAKIILTIRPRPVIKVTTEVLSQRLYLQGNPAPLSVDATVSEDKTLNYEWFYKVDGSETMTPISSASSAFYSPPVTTAPGIIYYYCQVTADQAEGVTELCGIVQTSKTMADPPELSDLPIITKEPQSQNISKDQPSFKLTVEAQLANGNLSYQWYQTDQALSVKGKPVENSNNRTITVSSAELSRPTYYYVEITSHQEGRSPTTRVSQIAKIRMQ